LTTLGRVPLAAVTFVFDPYVRLGDVAIRIETVALALTIAAACVLGGVIARRTPAVPGDRSAGTATLRAEDVVFVALAALPGAVAGGRIGYVLLHLDYYAARPAAILDPAQGSLELTLGVVGAALTGGVAARLLSGRAGPWFHAAAFPTLLVIGAGKVAMALGGWGQGLPDAGRWATSYAGPGPWGSIAPAVPSHPAQLYEAAATGVVALILLVASLLGAFRAADGKVWLIGVALWAGARTVVASTWRDAPVVGPLLAGQVLSIGLLAGCLGLAALMTASRRRPMRVATPGGSIVAGDHEIASRAETDTADPALQGSEERT
jgi:prolipoprotein diacylglyceryltransferase